MSCEYGMFVDCDCAFLEKDWDKTFLGFITDRIVIVGSEYDGAKYMNFPNLVGCLFKTDILKKVGVSMQPNSKPIVINESTKRIYGRDTGDVIKADAGWELCYKLKTNNYDGVILQLVRTHNKKGAVDDDNASRFIQKGMRGEEYQLNGIPIFTHVGRSSSRNFMTDDIVIRWRNRVSEWLDSENT